MVADPLDDLLRLRNEALSRLDGDSIAAQYQRGAIEMAWSKVVDDELRETRLEVRMVGAPTPTPRLTGQVLRAIDDATARIAHSMREPSWGGHRVSDADRAQVGLVQRQQVGNLLVFSAAGSIRTPGQLDPIVQTSGQQALRTLVELLPEDAEHDAALDAILGERPGVRRAVSDVVVAAAAAGGLGLRISSANLSDDGSVLTKAQAQVLKDSLLVSKDDLRTETVIGRIDGMRTRRRIFYLELDDTGAEIRGAIDQEQLDAVARHINQRVTATLEVRQAVAVSGRRGQRHYRLVGLRPVDEKLLAKSPASAGGPRARVALE